MNVPIPNQRGEMNTRNFVEKPPSLYSAMMQALKTSSSDTGPCRVGVGDVLLRGKDWTHGHAVPQLDPPALLQVPVLDPLRFIFAFSRANPEYPKTIQHAIIALR